MGFIGGIEVVALIFGIVEAAKEFGIQGKASRALALVLGFVLGGLAQLIGADMLSSDTVVIIELVVSALAYALAAMGYYDFLKKKVFSRGVVAAP